MKCYAGDLQIVEGDLIRSFDHALLDPGEVDHDTEGYGKAPWHPALAAILIGMGIRPSSVREACRHTGSTTSIRFTPQRDRSGHPVEGQRGVIIPESHPALTFDNSPEIFTYPEDLCCILFRDVGKPNIIMIPPDGRTLFEFNDTRSDPPVTLEIGPMPDSSAIAITATVTAARRSNRTLRLREISDVADPTIGDLRITRVERKKDSMIIEMH